MKPVFHITTEAEWEQALERGSHRPASFDKEGFIHLSEEAQVLATANRFFRGQTALLLLEIDRRRLGPALRHEEGEPGQLFPHLYSELAASAVISARPFAADADGVFRTIPPAKRR